MDIINNANSEVLSSNPQKSQDSFSDCHATVRRLWMLNETLTINHVGSVVVYSSKGEQRKKNHRTFLPPLAYSMIR